MTTYLWLGGDAAWSNGAQWDNASTGMTGVPPGAADVALFFTSDGGTLSGPGAASYLDVDATNLGLTGTVQAGTIGVVSNTSGPVPYYGSLTVDGGSVTATGGISVFANSSATITDGGTLTETSSTIPLVAFGSITVTNGMIQTGVLQAFSSIVIQTGSINAATLTMGMTGSLDISANSILTDSSAFLGNTAGSVTTATIHGGGAAFGSGNLVVGNQGSASLSITSGALALQTYAGGGIGQPALGVGSTGSGTLIVGGAMSQDEAASAVFGNVGTATIRVDTGGLLHVDGTLNEGHGSNGHESLDITGSGSNLMVGADDVIGDAGTASDLISSGASLTIGGALILGSQSSGTGSLSIDGAGTTGSVVADSTIGSQGIGTLSVTGGGSFDTGAGALSLGVFTTAGGLLSLSGSGSHVSVGGTLAVGDTGSARVAIAAGTTLLATGSAVYFAAVGSGAAGTLTATGSNAIFSAPNASVFDVADEGTALLRVSGGAVANLPAAILRIGEENGSHGTVDVSDMPGTLTAANIVVGDNGSGTLSAASGASVFGMNDIVLGQAASGVGSIDVSSATLSSNGNLTVGESGAGTLTVNGDAGLNIHGEMVLGMSAASTGVVSLVNTGLRLLDMLTVGAAGAGTLSIMSNTKVHSASLMLGSMAGGSGIVSLLGAGSLIAQVVVDDGLAIGGTDAGAGGSGMLTVDQAATVTAGSIEVWGAGSVSLAGGLLTGGSIMSSGLVSGFGTLDGTLANTGTITASSGTLVLTGAVTGSGALGLSAGTVLELMATSAAGQSVGFSGGDLMLDTLPGALAVIHNFGGGDTIDVLGLGAEGGEWAGGVLTLTDGSGFALGTLAVAGSYVSGNFAVAALTPSHTRITFDASAACFAAGTRIATEHGEVAVERLSVGQRVLLAEGGTAAVVWLGHRRVDCTRHPAPWDVWPIRVQAGAFGPGRPHADLRLSPDHAVFVDGVLIPIRYLANGASIRQERCDAVTYFHVELPAHGVLLADGLPAESYLDTGNRAAFANGGRLAMATPDFARGVWAAEAAAPLVLDGPKLTAVRAATLARCPALGHRLDPDPAIRVLTEDGLALPITRAGARCHVAVPFGTDRVRIVSRCFVPALASSCSADHRRLGVALGRLMIDGAAVALADARLQAGWHAAEPAWRWTNGDAAIAACRRLSFEVLLSGEYWCYPPAVQKTAELLRPG